MPIKNKMPKTYVALTVNGCINALEGVNPSKVKRAVDTGEVPSYRVGVHKMVLVIDLQNWVRSHPRGAITE
jgi:hypothetical protein